MTAWFYIPDMKIRYSQTAMALALMATGAIPLAAAHEQVRQEALVARTSAVVMHAVRGPGPLDTAIRVLLCLEASEATRAGTLSGDVLEWILANAHRCEDQRLLVEAFGF